ncbi:hypothetical protein Tco_1150541 [Tanacetum coccineum]
MIRPSIEVHDNTRTTGTGPTMKTTLKIGKSNEYGSKPGSKAMLLIEVLAKGSKVESIMFVQDVNIHSQALLHAKDSNKIDALKEIGCIDTEPGIIGRSRSWLWLYRCKLTENLKAEVLEADDHVNVVLESNKPESAALNLHIIYPGIFQMEVLLRSEPGAPLTMNQQVIIGVAVSILATPSELIKCRGCNMRVYRSFIAQLWLTHWLFMSYHLIDVREQKDVQHLDICLNVESNFQDRRME